MTNNTYLPAGWVRDVANLQYRGPNGEIITDLDVSQYGSLSNALIGKYGQGQMKIHNYRPSNPKVGDVVVSSGLTEVYTNHGWVTNHHITSAGAANMVNNGGYAAITAAPIQPKSTLAFDTAYGRVTLDIKTGDLTVPVGMSRQDAIRDFWLGFQENFQPTNKAKYEQQIKDLQQDLARVQATAALMRKDDEKEAAKKVAEKIAKKYNGEKFIMVKPEDLIRFIEES